MARDSKKRALIAFLFGYGKRISEVIELTRFDVYIADQYIETTFKILKRKPESGILPVFSKRLSSEHYLAPFIVDYVEQFEEGYLFPGRSEGHISRMTAYRWLKKISDDLWPHLFRHSLATLMAENGATAYELKSFFDWKDIRTATRYVEDTQGLSYKWVDREF